MQVGEAVAADVAAENHDESCYFCKSTEEPATEENTLDDSYPEDEDLDGALDDVKFKNDASKLGKALGGVPDNKCVGFQVTVRSGAKRVKQTMSLEVKVAAHHLIPGNASLKQSELFKSKKYIWKNGVAKGNIGYNVNAKPNGVWLPGNYAMRPWGTGGATFAEQRGITPEDYAFEAIEAWNAQFHDAHGIYSDFVKDALDKIYDKLEANASLWCPEAKKNEKKASERSPMYVLVSRLNTISGRMKRMLKTPTMNWRKNVYTSRFSKDYIDKKPHRSADD